MAGLLADASECENRVLVDGNLITSRSPGTAMEFAVAIVEKVMGERGRAGGGGRLALESYRVL